MSPQPVDPQQPHVRKVTLPSGKTIEVVYFDDTATTSQPAGAQTTDDLHHCGTCGSDLVYPVEWHESGSEHWRVTLRCPNCEWTGTGVFDQDSVERFDAELDRGTEALVDDLKRLMHASMEDEVGRFISALDAGAITPDDF